MCPRSRSGRALLALAPPSASPYFSQSAQSLDAISSRGRINPVFLLEYRRTRKQLCDSRARTLPDIDPTQKRMCSI